MFQYSYSLALDLGSNYIRIWSKEKELLLEEPSLMVLDEQKRLIEIGKKANQMQGRLEKNWQIIKPISRGRITNYKRGIQLIQYCIQKIIPRWSIWRPKIMLIIPPTSSKAYQRNLIQMASQAGTQKAYLINSLLATALGTNIAINKSKGLLIGDLGGGKTEFGLLSAGSLHKSAKSTTSGHTIDQAIQHYLIRKLRFKICQEDLENIKSEIASALPSAQEKKYQARGHNLETQLPDQKIIHTNELIDPIQSQLIPMVQATKKILYHISAELSSDIYDKGLLLTGGIAKLQNIDSFFSQMLNIPCYNTQDSSSTTIKGAAIALKHLDSYIQIST